MQEQLSNFDKFIERHANVLGNAQVEINKAEFRSLVEENFVTKNIGENNYHQFSSDYLNDNPDVSPYEYEYVSVKNQNILNNKANTAYKQEVSVRRAALKTGVTDANKVIRLRIESMKNQQLASADLGSAQYASEKSSIEQMISTNQELESLYPHISRLATENQTINLDPKTQELTPDGRKIHEDLSKLMQRNRAALDVLRIQVGLKKLSIDLFPEDGSLSFIDFPTEVLELLENKIVDLFTANKDKPEYITYFKDAGLKNLAKEFQKKVDDRNALYTASTVRPHQRTAEQKQSLEDFRINNIKNSHQLAKIHATSVLILGLFLGTLPV